jgi:hypothetical protein
MVNLPAIAYAKTLSERQILLLDSIRYKDASAFREFDEEEWESKFTELKHLGTGQKNGALSSWVSRQKRKGFEDKLPAEKRRRLEEIGIDFSLFTKPIKKRRK